MKTTQNPKPVNLELSHNSETDAQPALKAQYLGCLAGLSTRLTTLKPVAHQLLALGVTRAALVRWAVAAYRAA